MSGKRAEKQNPRQSGIVVFVVLLMLAFSLRVAIVRTLPNDAPDDGLVYDQMARNLVEQHVYSHDTEPPYQPSLIRMPGYSLFLAGVYKVFGHDKTAVRIIQALMDTATCGMIGLLAWFWDPDKARKRASSIAAIVLAAVCPFTVIYTATILSENAAMFFAIAMCLTATLALRASSQKKTLLWLLVSGLIAGLAVFFRPDSGLFALAIGLTVVVATLSRPSGVALKSKREEIFYRFGRTAYLGAAFSLVFCLVLVPWTIRNHRVFHVFQPLSPAHGEMPGEFVARGYLTWTRTWIDDQRYIGPVIWQLDTSPIKLKSIPDKAFDSAEEKARVSALLDKYNRAGEETGLFTDENQTSKDEDAQADEADQDNSNQNNDEADNSDDADKGDEGDENDSEDEADDSSADNQSADVAMTPEIDAGFAQLAQERIAHHPFRYYVWLPLKRASSLWFDTHSDYYPFQGELLPLRDLDHSINQQIWLPLFSGLTLVYTLLGIAGAWFLWRAGNLNTRLWLLLAALMILLRVGFFSTMENPEPRYVVEVFPFLSVLGGIALLRLGPGLLAKGK
ncbi:MAG TPA: glycosyltransferase family 39 protein [Pyrinomonadaceae bacterium]|nr:glycosyltransferase family 39 protein [Pyrinomonadaceae bacterium]